MKRTALGAVSVALAALAFSALAHADTWRIEAELAGPGDTAPIPPGATAKGATWKIEKAPDAGGGQYLSAPIYGFGETNLIALRIPHAGIYRGWVRHYKTPGKFTGLFVLFRDDANEGVLLQKFDWATRVASTRPYEPVPEAPKDAKPAFVWTPFTVLFDRPMDATVCFGPSRGLAGGKVGIDCLILSDDPAFDPEKADWAALPTEPGASGPSNPPRGMKPAPVFTLNSAFFSSEPNVDRRFRFALLNGAWTMYRNFPWLLQLGANSDHGWNSGSTQYGFRCMVEPAWGYSLQDLLKTVPSPTGRFMNADGKVSVRRFSDCYEPAREAFRKEFIQKLEAFKDRDDIEGFSVIGEAVGNFDYSDPSRDAFHQWLQERFGTIAELNKLWGTTYETFDKIPLPKMPKNPEDSRASWFAFREFRGLQLVRAVAEKVQLIQQHDPKRRPAMDQMSCLGIQSPSFTNIGPLDFEDIINVAFADQPTIGFDAYSTEDYFVGCDLEYLMSLAGNRRVYNEEWNVHGQDPRIEARSFWGMVAKGIHGVSCYEFQENPQDTVNPMWAMLKMDLTPRDKLGALADAAHEVRRLEHILMNARRVHAVKPVALYFSRMDLSLPQPMTDFYGAALDSPYRVYEILRSLGYPVRWITPRQIDAGQLDGVGAVALVGVQHVPGKTAATLAKWVEDGGCLIGDDWPGVFDEYGRQQGTFAPVFGIRAAQSGKAMTPEEAKHQLEQTTTTVYGVDPQVLRALNPNDVLKRVDEMYEQWDATHPVALKIGNFHLSGYDLKQVRCVSGSVIGMGLSGSGSPGLVLNDYGKGHALYSAIMLGTLFESGPIRYEWDSSREGHAIYRILDAYLRYCGLAPSYEAQLPERVARKMRVESPIVDAKGNVFVGMTSLNDIPLQPFPLAIRWPGNAPKPGIVLVCTGGSRRIQKVAFDLKDGTLTVAMPAFDTHAAVLALNDSAPLVSLEVTGVARGAAGLLDARPGARLTVKATVWNPSPRKLARGRLNLYAAPGWYADQGEDTLRAISAFDSRDTEFEVAPPALCGYRTLRPILVKYQSEDAQSALATELLWWSPTASDAR